MDTTPPDFGAGASDFETPTSAPRAGARWVWAPLAIGTALAFATSAMGNLYSALLMTLNAPWFFTYQRVLSAISSLVVPAVVALATIAVARRAPAIENRRAIVARLLGAFALQIGAIFLVSFGGNALLGPFETAEGVAAGQSLPFTLLSIALGTASWFPLGVTLAIAMGVLTPGVAPRNWPRRLAYWSLAGALAGLAAAFFTLLAPVLLDSLMAARLAAIGVQNCQANSGASCLPSQLLFLAQQLGLSALIGVAVGAVVGGFIAPELARLAATPIEPAPPGERRSWLARARRALVDVALGVAYLALVVGLISVLSIGRTFTLSGLAAGWSYMIELLALLSPAGWLALLLARSRLASALDERGKRALRWALLALAAFIAIALPGVIGGVYSPLFASDSTVVSLIALSFGASFGLARSSVGTGAPRRGAVWRDGAGAAFMGWLGVATPAAVLEGVSVYSFLTYDATASGCHGLGCGGLAIAAYGSFVSGFVYIIVYGLLAATAGGAVGGMLRAALRAA